MTFQSQLRFSPLAKWFQLIGTWRRAGLSRHGGREAHQNRTRPHHFHQCRPARQPAAAPGAHRINLAEALGYLLTGADKQAAENLGLECRKPGGRVVGPAYVAGAVLTRRIGGKLAAAPDAQPINLAEALRFLLKGADDAIAAALGLHRREPGGHVTGKRCG